MKVVMIFLISVGLPFKAFGQCKLPSPDQAAASMPAFKGTLTEINQEERTVKLKVGKSLIEIDLSKVQKSNIFSQFGGIVPARELKVGDIMEVWLKNCATTSSKKVSPEVIRIQR